MILQNHIRGRRRVLDGAKKARLCELISQESYSVEQAADSLDVSLRTIQRERKYDQDFDHEVRLALQGPPDPLKLMEHAARTHWRAAAWLLERRNPEEFARKPVNTTNPKKALAALRYIQEAALQAIPAEFHEAVYHHTQAAMDQAFDNCFPTMGPWGQPKLNKLPVDTPLADVQWDKVWRAQTRVLPDRTPPVDPRFDDRPEEYVDVEVQTDLGPIEVSLPPADHRHMQQLIAAAVGQAFSLTAPPNDSATPPRPNEPQQQAPNVSPKTPEATKVDGATETPTSTKFAAQSDDAILSPKTSAATEWPPATKRFDPAANLAMLEELASTHCPEAWFKNDDFDHHDSEDPQTRILLLDERLRRHQRRERQQERAAEKKAKAARKRAKRRMNAP